MVTARKSRKSPRASHRETLAEKFDRVLAEPAAAPFPKLTKREARYFLKRLSGIGGPDAPRGDDVLREFYGLNPDGSEISADTA